MRNQLNNNAISHTGHCAEQDTEPHFFDNRSFFKNDENVYIQLSTEFPEFVGIEHKHQFVEIVYILSGSAVHTVGGREYHVKCGDITIINSGITHKFTSDINSDENFVTYDLMFSPDFFGAGDIEMGEFEALKNNFLFHSMFPMDAGSQPDMHISGGGYSDYGEIFTRIYHEYNRKERGFIQIIRAYIIELIIKLFRNIEQTEEIVLPPDQLDSITNAANYIESNYTSKLSIDDIASRAFLSPDYFRKLFKKVTGSSVTSFQQKLRIDEACRLLSTTDVPIKDICVSIGYNDMAAFYQIFKKVTGKTPNEYRKNQ